MARREPASSALTVASTAAVTRCREAAPHGAKKAPFYRIVVADSRAPRDGAFVEEIGYYNPLSNPVELTVNNEHAAEWIKKGAQPTDTVRALLKKSGAIE